MACDLAAIRARQEAYERGCTCRAGLPPSGCPCCEAEGAAPEDVAALLEECERLRERTEILQGALTLVSRRTQRISDLVYAVCHGKGDEPLKAVKEWVEYDRLAFEAQCQAHEAECRAKYGEDWRDA